MADDSELLRLYAESRAEDAFAELVRRRINLVYSIALRHVGGDAHLARDVVQRVFSSLAQKAGALSRRPVLSGWLHQSTRFAASDEWPALKPMERSKRFHRVGSGCLALLAAWAHGQSGAVADEPPCATAARSK